MLKMFLKILCPLQQHTMHRMFDDYKDRAGELERKIPRMLSIVSHVSDTPTISSAQHLCIPVNYVLIFVNKKWGGGLDLISVLVVSPLSFLQYVSESIQLKKRSKRIEYML